MKSDSGRKSRGHPTSKTVKASQSYSNGHLSYCLFYYLAPSLVHACEFACAVRMRRRIGTNALNNTESNFHAELSGKSK